MRKNLRLVETKMAVLLHGHFWNRDISQGSVATRLKCAEICSNHVTAILQTRWIISEIWRNYHNEFDVFFLKTCVWQDKKLSCSIHTCTYEPRDAMYQLNFSKTQHKCSTNYSKITKKPCSRWIILKVSLVNKDEYKVMSSKMTRFDRPWHFL